jgi:hypothetical protein
MSIIFLIKMIFLLGNWKNIVFMKTRQSNHLTLIKTVQYFAVFQMTNESITRANAVICGTYTHILHTIHYIVLTNFERTTSLLANYN